MLYNIIYDGIIKFRIIKIKLLFMKEYHDLNLNYKNKILFMKEYHDLNLNYKNKIIYEGILLLNLDYKNKIIYEGIPRFKFGLFGIKF
jgi:hypothetical protein